MLCPYYGILFGLGATAATAATDYVADETDKLSVPIASLIRDLWLCQRLSVAEVMRSALRADREFLSSLQTKFDSDRALTISNSSNTVSL